MNHQKVLEAQQIAAYLEGAEQWLAEHAPDTTELVLDDGVTLENGVFTIEIPAHAKPISELGGPTKVFGPSQIWIPEYKLENED